MSTYDPNDLRREDEEVAPEPEECAEDGENEEEYEEYVESDESDEDYDGDVEEDDGEEEEEENLAAVAERITGMRHSQVVSAAPIRTRDDEQLPAASKPLSQPAAPANDIPPRPHPIQADGTAEPLSGTAASAKKKSRVRWKYVIPAVLLIAVLGGILIAALNRSSDEAGKAEPPEDSAVTDTQTPDSPASPADAMTEQKTGETEEASVPEESDEQQEPDDSSESAEAAEPSEQSPAAAEEEPGEEPAEETPADSEPEPEPVSEPEPVYEPEPEPDPEFWLQVNFYDRDPVGAMTTATTLRQFLNDRQIWLADGEVPTVGLDEWLTDYVTVNVDKYEWGIETVSEVIPYTSEITELDTIPKGTTNVLRTGENGAKETVYNIEYKNGQEFLRSVQSETVTKEPVSEQVETGVGGTIQGIDGNTYSYNYRRTVQATYYNLEGLTYLGTMADESVIAVDQNSIPLGTQVYVKNDRYDFGVRTAADIGGQVDNWEIDIWLSPSNPYFPAFSREGYIYDMEIYYLD